MQPATNIMITNNSKFSLILLSGISLFLVGLLVLGTMTIRNKNEKTSLLLNQLDQVSEVETMAQFVSSFRDDATEELEVFEQI